MPCSFPCTRCAVVGLSQTCDTPEEASELEAEKAEVAAMTDGDEKKAAKKALAAKLDAKLGAVNYGNFVNERWATPLR